MSAIELREKATRINMQARDLIGSIAKDNLSEERAKEIDGQVDRMLAEADALEARAKRFDELDARDAALAAADTRRPVSAEARGTYAPKATAEAHLEAFDRLVRGWELNADQARIIAEKRDMSVGTNSAGGFLVPTTLVDQVIIATKAYGPMMDPSAFNQIRTSTGNPLNFPYMDDTANTGRLITEAAVVNAANTPVLSQVTLNAYKYTSDFFKLSSELLQDSEIDVQQLVVDAIAERMGRIANLDLTTGSGSNKPNGILTAVGTPALATANAAAIGYGDIIEAIHQLDPSYRSGPKVRFMFSDNVLKAIRKLTDTQGHPLWEPALQNGAPERFAGYEYLINQNMPSLASGNVGLLFGDFSKFTIRISKDLVVKRTDDRFIDYDQTAWVAFMRIDSDLMNLNAVKGLKIT